MTLVLPLFAQNKKAGDKKGNGDTKKDNQ